MTRLVLLVALLASVVASADIPPPDSMGCRDKAAGAVCKRDDGTEASCVNAKCSHRDYSNGPPGAMVQSDCLKCLPAAAAPTPPPAAAPAVAETPAPPAKKNSCSAVPAETAVGLFSLLFLRRRRAQQATALESAGGAVSATVDP